MKNDFSRVLVQTVVQKALGDIRESPERGIRNLVDMARQFSKGQFQHVFFAVAQAMLENENSAYYRLVYDMVSHVDVDRLVTFGMNLGYNGCTMGVKRIRESETQLNCVIPWTVLWNVDDKAYGEHQQAYHTAIASGENLGIYFWTLFPSGEPARILPLIHAHQDSAFALFCQPESITPHFIAVASEVKNLMPVVRYNEQDTQAFALLRDAGMLYSAYYPYALQDLAAIISGDLFCSIQQVHPAFSVFAAGSDCTEDARILAHQAIQKARDEQQYQTMLWEMNVDSRQIDRVISNNDCMILFDKAGDLWQYSGAWLKKPYNLFDTSLEYVFEQALKTSGVAKG